MPEVSVAVLNTDIPEYERLNEVCQKQGHTVITYGRKAKDIKILNIVHQPDYQIVDVNIYGTDYKLQINLRGEFQIYNVLCAVSLCIACGAEVKHVVDQVQFLKPAPGRLEKVLKEGNTKQIYVDYAHTPDALEKVLKTLREGLTGNGKLYVVFGCGGERDAEKRPIMGKIALNNADKVFVTDDNPRRDDPETIRQQIIAACPNAFEVSDRRVAIKTAIDMLNPEDILLIAGKGHEDTQIYGTDIVPFDDVEVAKEYI
jgi:UDP-N-acetylmuramoyl-L-alanyl-D-glutamate--2,6-diaminopimelate ligase